MSTTMAFPTQWLVIGVPVVTLKKETFFFYGTWLDMVMAS